MTIEYLLVQIGSMVATVGVGIMAVRRYVARTDAAFQAAVAKMDAATAAALSRTNAVAWSGPATNGIGPSSIPPMPVTGS